MISSSGPTRSVAFASFAFLMLRRILSRFPSKSKAHWLSWHVANVVTVIIVSLGLRKIFELDISAGGALVFVEG